MSWRKLFYWGRPMRRTSSAKRGSEWRASNLGSHFTWTRKAGRSWKALSSPSQHLEALRYGLVILAGIEVVPGQAGVQARLERIELHRPLALGHPFLLPVHGHQEVGVVVAHVRLAGVQLQRPPE